MKLYNLDHSPFATRVRIAIRHKGLDIALEPPPVPLRTPEFEARFPLGKIPVLELTGGGQVADSWAILQYLEDVHPEPALRPEAALARAQMLMMARCADTCLGPDGLFPLFQRVSSRGEGDFEPELDALGVELARLERLLAQLPDYRGRSLHLGDIALVPHIDYVQLLAPLFGRDQVLADYPLVGGWWEWVTGEEAVAACSGEMRAAVAKFFGG